MSKTKQRARRSGRVKMSPAQRERLLRELSVSNRAGPGITSHNSPASEKLALAIHNRINQAHGTPPPMPTPRPGPQGLRPGHDLNRQHPSKPHPGVRPVHNLNREQLLAPLPGWQPGFNPHRRHEPTPHLDFGPEDLRPGHGPIRKHEPAPHFEFGPEDLRPGHDPIRRHEPAPRFDFGPDDLRPGHGPRRRHVPIPAEGPVRVSASRPIVALAGPRAVPLVRHPWPGASIPDYRDEAKQILKDYGVSATAGAVGALDSRRARKAVLNATRKYRQWPTSNTSTARRVVKAVDKRLPDAWKSPREFFSKRNPGGWRELRDMHRINSLDKLQEFGLGVGKNSEANRILQQQLAQKVNRGIANTGKVLGVAGKYLGPFVGGVQALKETKPEMSRAKKFTEFLKGAAREADDALIATTAGGLAAGATSFTGPGAAVVGGAAGAAAGYAWDQLPLDQKFDSAVNSFGDNYVYPAAQTVFEDWGLDAFLDATAYRPQPDPLHNRIGQKDWPQDWIMP